MKTTQYLERELKIMNARLALAREAINGSSTELTLQWAQRAVTEITIELAAKQDLYDRLKRAEDAMDDCDCSDCVDREKPCKADCDRDDSCKGCQERAQMADEARFEIDSQTGRHSGRA